MTSAAQSSSNDLKNMDMALENSIVKNVGIMAMEVYFPPTFVKQSSLEEYSGVAAGKYTIGLGQESISIVTGDVEDVNSICLTVVHNLLEKYAIDPMTVGRLEVGTETLVDKSKSTKTVLMDLFPGNTDIEGATIVNACYGGTAALFNAMLWCQSDDWDGRYAIVVAADIAAYAKGPARPTCGIGAVAMLVGRNAPIVFHGRHRATHACNAWDFYKPDHTVEYPVVDGALSQICYYRALEDVYDRFVTKMNAKGDNEFDVESADYFVFHAPYNKLVQKSYARLYLCDARRRYVAKREEWNDNGTVEEKKELTLNGDNIHAVNERHQEIDTILSNYVRKPIEQTYDDKELEGILKKLSNKSFQKKLVDANRASQLVGNTYTASVFFGLASLIDRAANDLTPGKNIVMFSYGSGAIASMYHFEIRQPIVSNVANGHHLSFKKPLIQTTVQTIGQTMNLTQRLQSRVEVHPKELDDALETRATMHNAGVPYQPVYPTIGRLYPGTYFLKGIDEKWRRTYSRVPFDAFIVKQDSSSSSLLPPHVSQKHRRIIPVSNSTVKPQESNVSNDLPRKPVGCVITGTAAALPCGKNPFAKDNMDRLLSGHQFIGPVSDTLKKAMLDKNIVQIKRSDDKTIQRFLVNTENQVIQLAAQLGPYDLTEHYGVVEGLAQTMDTAAQIAVAAGLEALKNAGLVSGQSNNPSEWQLQEKYRATTGVVYASSFPALDAAIGEVMRFLRSKTVHATGSEQLLAIIRKRLLRSGDLTIDDENSLRQLLSRAKDAVDSDSEKDEDDPTIVSRYEFDRKFLFKLLVLGNAQLAQLTGCRGPNTQTNAACAGTTQAIAMAQDMLLSGRAQRVVVIAGDNASGETLLPWLGSGFRALGAACIKDRVEDAALPFDKRRSGLLLGAGGIGMVLETEQSCNERIQTTPYPFVVKARLVASQYSNSAYHGAALDRKHIGEELKRFLQDVEMIHGISKEDVATHGVYFSHETCTHASSASSCSGNEIAALRYAFDQNDELVSKLLIVNTKGYTGHPMGVSFEDVTAVEVLMKQIVPPMPNYKVPDDYLGPLKLSQGGSYECRYALRFAAGFGSQVAFALYAKA